MNDQEEFENQEGLEEGLEEEEYHVPTFEEMMAARKLTMQDIKEHISGPVLSFIVHIVILAVLSTIIVFQAPKEGSDIEVKEVVVDVKPLEKKIEPPEPEEVEPQEDIDVETPSPDVSETPSPTVEDVQVDSAPANDITVPNILSVKPSNSALVMPALFGGRTGKGRAGALKRYGGGSRTERAVLRGLRWLKDHQNEDGSWGDTAQNNFSAYTGMALLAFLAHGETPSSPEFGQTVLKAIKKLIEYVGPDGNGVTGGYRHGIVMYALSEAYACTKIPMLEGVVNGGMTKLINGMNASGGFNYGYGDAHGAGRSDLSVSGWNYQALKAAFAAGCSAPGLEAAIEKSINIGLKQTFYVKAQGCFCYSALGGQQQNPEGTMTSVGTLCLQLFGAGEAPEAKAGLKYLEQPNQFSFSWRNPVHPNWSVYQWYYETQCFFQGYKGTGPKWKEWNKMFSRELIRRQKEDGRWETPEYENGKKGGEANLSGLDQPVFATSLCCLMLEVYYRYLPTFKVAHVRPAAAAGASDELGLE